MVIGNAAAAWDAEYTHGRYRDEPPVDFVDDILAAATGERLRSGVYIGCGNGRNLLPLLDAGLDLAGLDISAEAISLLDPIVVILDVDVGVGSVDPHAEQAADSDALRCGEQVLMRMAPAAMLEDLDADDQLITGPGRKRGEVADDQLVGSFGSSLAAATPSATKPNPRRDWTSTSSQPPS